MEILTKTEASSLLFSWNRINLFLEKVLIFWGKLCLKLTNCVTINTVFMRLFGYPYNNDLVICKDSPDYLGFAVISIAPASPPQIFVKCYISTSQNNFMYR